MSVLRRPITWVLLAILLLTGNTSYGQLEGGEDLAPILERGYIAHWLVCGPFVSDVPGGILAAIRDDAAAISERDFMEPAGGVPRLRPQHLQRIATPEGGEAIWQRAGTTGPELDLAPFFPGEPAGVAYAAFYLQSPGRSQMLIDVESPLGVRAWANGFPATEYAPGPMASVGKDEFAVSLRPGLNLIVFEVPGADYALMARARGLNVGQLTAGTMENRPRLRKTSGFAISLVPRPAQSLGERVVYVPDLKSAGTFSGFGDDLKQDLLFTLHNPTEEISEPIEAIVSTSDMPLPALVKIEALDAGETRHVTFSIPVASVNPGTSVDVSVRLHSGSVDGAFRDGVVVDTRGEGPGVMRIITGHTLATTKNPEDDQVYLERVNRQLLFSQTTLGYGFDLGYAAEWHKPFVGLPAQRERMQRATQRGAATVQGRYAPIDERVAGSTALWRNLQIGLHMAGSQLNSTTPHYLAWNAPAIAPQTPQMLRHTPMNGMITNLSAQGLAPINRLYDLSGETEYLRRKLKSPGPGTIADVREMVALQRRELMDLGISSDVLVVENIVPPPEPFYRGSVDELARAYPRIRLDEGGGARFFEDVAGEGEAVQSAIAPASLDLNLGQPGDLLTMPALQRAHAAVARQLEDGEALATLASLHGAIYPHAAMEFAWRQLIYHSTPEQLGTPNANESVFDALAGYREVAEWSADSLRRSRTFIADAINTGAAVPLNQGDLQALVVFNPNGVAATLPVHTLLPIAAPSGILLLDGSGKAVPFSARPYQGGQEIEFVAHDLPSYGYDTWFFRASPDVVAPVIGEDLQIENESLALFVDPKTGAIASIMNKLTGENINQGLMNQFMLLSESESENKGGTELWTTSTDGALSSPGKITSDRVSFRQRITVTTPLGGGTLTQRYTLYKGVPTIYCETTLDGVGLSGKAAVAVFNFPHEGRSLLVGERLGALVGARGQEDFAIKTRGGENVGGTVPYPANEWVALSGNDAIQVGSDGLVPWEPALIIHGDSPVLKQAARKLQKALITRGIPSIVQADVIPKPDFLWTDSTTEQNSNDYLSAGYRMRVVIGSPDQNRFCEGLFKQVPDEMVRAFSEHIPNGARLLMHDKEVPKDLAPVPTLMLGGLTPAQSAELADSLTYAVQSGQRYLLPPSVYVPDTAQKEVTGGVALLFDGTMSVAQQKDGRLLLGLQHRSGLEKVGGNGAALLKKTTFNYGIAPFSGTWREAQVPLMAARYNIKPTATITGIHPGSLSPRQGFLEVSPPGLRLGGLKATGFPTTTNTRTAFHPRDGISLYAWEPQGEDWSGSLESGSAVLEANRATVLERPDGALTRSGNNVSLDVGRFEFVPLQLLSAVTKPLDGLGRLGRDEEPYGVIETRYWEERRGAAPLRKMPLGVLIQGSLAKGSDSIDVIVSNHCTDRRAQGTVTLEGTSGLSFGPQDFYYDLGPGQQHVEPIQLARTPGLDGDIGMSAETDFERQTYRDVLMTNEAPYVVETTRNGSQVRVVVKNDSSIYAKGYLDAITGPEFWPELGTQPDVTIAPRRATLSIPPHKSQSVVFVLSEPTAKVPVMIKLAANRKVTYIRATDTVSADATATGDGGPALTVSPLAPPPPRGRNPQN